jgi:quinol monooxygenase YgiN
MNSKVDFSDVTETKEDVIKSLYNKNEILSLNVIYTIKDGKRDEFYNKLQESNIICNSREEKGNINYDYYFDVDDENKILLVEAWVNQKMQEEHLKTTHYQKLQELKSEYVINVDIKKYYSAI